MVLELISLRFIIIKCLVCVFILYISKSRVTQKFWGVKLNPDWKTFTNPCSEGCRQDVRADGIGNQRKLRSGVEACTEAGGW